MSFLSTTKRNIFFLACHLFASTGVASEPNNSFPIHEEEEEGNWVISADFLAWSASEEVASIWVDFITFKENATTWAFPGFDFSWDYGFRVGAGRDLEYDGWDTTLYWNWFRTKATHEIPPGLNTFIQPEFFAGFLSGAEPQSVIGTWSLLLNMFDWELGRVYWVSNNVSLRPFLGIKGGWIHQSIQTDYYDLILDFIIPTEHSGHEGLKNNFWGVGPLGGVNTKWKVGDFKSHFFDIFGDFSLATMWGSWSCSDLYKDTLSQSYSVITKNSSLGALMFRGFLGIGWEVDLGANESHFSAKLGYEMQLWLNQLRISTFQLQRLHNDLTLQGITLNAQFDF